jgi:hypothetical protein
LFNASSASIGSTYACRITKNNYLSNTRKSCSQLDSGWWETCKPLHPQAHRRQIHPHNRQSVEKKQWSDTPTNKFAGSKRVNMFPTWYTSSPWSSMASSRATNLRS